MGWPEALASDCLCVHLNFAGEGRLTLPGGRDFLLRAQTLAFSRGITAAIRTTSRDRHECLTLCYPHSWLADHLREAGSQLTGQAQRLISAPFDPMVAQGRPLKPDDQTWARTLMAPHLCIAARKLMEGARLTDFLISELFLLFAVRRASGKHHDSCRASCFGQSGKGENGGAPAFG